jgi:hypothetical protein
VPHFCKPGKTTGRIVGIGDLGMRIRIGRSELIALPAHFMHAEGNFQFFDPTSGILFSGDLGVSLLSGRRPAKTRCRACSRCPRHGGLPPALHGVEQDPAPVGRHGGAAAHPHDRAAARRPAGGPGGARVHRLGRELPCGVDLMTQRDYARPDLTKATRRFHA